MNESFLMNNDGACQVVKFLGVLYLSLKYEELWESNKGKSLLWESQNTSSPFYKDCDSNFD